MTTASFHAKLGKPIIDNQHLINADHAVMIDDLQKVLHQQRQKVAMINGTPSPEEDPMIHIGDVNYPPPAAASPSAPAAPSFLSKLLPIALGAGLLATGAGAGIGIPMLLSAFASKPTAVPQIITKEWDSAVDMIVTPPGN